MNKRQIPKFSSHDFLPIDFVDLPIRHMGEETTVKELHAKDGGYLFLSPVVISCTSCKPIKCLLWKNDRNTMKVGEIDKKIPV